MVAVATEPEPEPEPEPGQQEPVLEREPEVQLTSLVSVSVPGLGLQIVLLVMALAPALVPESARDTVAPPQRARACHDHPPPALLHPSDDRTQHRRLFQHPRMHTTSVSQGSDLATCTVHQHAVNG
jgi:hypothetical protein